MRLGQAREDNGEVAPWMLRCMEFSARNWSRQTYMGSSELKRCCTPTVGLDMTNNSGLRF
jgi:hypothetical protein